MPISKYFHGNGTEVLKNMEKEYGGKKGESVFYATANKRGEKPADDLAPIPVDSETRAAVAAHNAGLTKSQDRHAKDESPMPTKWQDAPKHEPHKFVPDRPGSNQCKICAFSKGHQLHTAKAQDILPVPVRPMSVAPVSMPSGQRNEPELAPVPVGDSETAAELMRKGGYAEQGNEFKRAFEFYKKAKVVFDNEGNSKGMRDAYEAMLEMKRHTEHRAKDAGDVRIVHNKLLGGWYVVRGPHQTPLSGRFNSKEEAQASLNRPAKDSSLPAPIGDVERQTTYAKMPAKPRPVMSVLNRSDLDKMTGRPDAPLTFDAKAKDRAHAADSIIDPKVHLDNAWRYEIAGDRARALDSYRAAAAGFRRAGDTKMLSTANDGIAECQRRMVKCEDQAYEHPRRGRAQAFDTEDRAVRTALERTRAGEDVHVDGTKVLPGRAARA